MVDNGSTDDSLNALQEQFTGPVTFLKSEKNLGFARGNNIGIRYCLQQGCDYIMLLNNDTEVEKDFLDKLLSTIETHPDIAAIQPKILFLHDKGIIWNAGGFYNPWFGEPKTRGYGRRNHGQFDQAGKIDWVTGCCLLIKSQVVKEIGLLNSDFFMYVEDLDWSLRMRAKGYILYYEPQSVVYHAAGAAYKARRAGKEGYINPIVHYTTIRNHIIVLRQSTVFYRIPSVFMYQAIKLASHGVYFTARRRWNKVRALAWAIEDGLRDQSRIHFFLK